MHMEYQSVRLWRESKMTFKEKWADAVKKKNSVLCAGLDPADFEMERGEKGLSEGVDKFEWAHQYIDAVAPFCAAVKPNIQYWKGAGNLKSLDELYEHANDMGMVVIDDSKLADIGSTNDAGMFHGSIRSDAVTLAPYAGNMGEAAKMAKARNLGLITMCLMSNPEYKGEKNMLVDVPGVKVPGYFASDVSVRVPRYVKLAHDAEEFGLDGLVIGAPSKKNHISKKEIAKVRRYVGDDMLVLLPGVGAQGGEADAIWQYFGKDNVIVNVGRSLMFPNGSTSTYKDHQETAEKYQVMLNSKR